MPSNAPQFKSVASFLFAAAAATCLAASPAQAAGADAKGTIVYKDRTTTVKYAYLVSGPDSISKQPIRRLILSPVDLGAKIAACKTLSCTNTGLEEGLSVNFDVGPRMEYWMVQNGQKVQYSGTEPLPSLVAKVNDGKQMTGTLKFDKSGAGGPKVDVEFDAALAKALTAP